MWAEAIGFEPMGHSHDLRFSRPAHSTTLPNLQIDTLGLHSTTLPTFLDKIRLIVKAEREGFEPPDPLLSFLRGPTIASLIKTSYICLRAINQTPIGYGADSHCFSLSQSPLRCFTFQ